MTDISFIKLLPRQIANYYIDKNQLQVRFKELH